jgi:hypothetical protein
MTKRNLYRYVGRNGIITSFVCLDDAKHYVMYRLIADDGKILTDGFQKVKFVDIFAEDLSNWIEIEYKEDNIEGQT